MLQILHVIVLAMYEVVTLNTRQYTFWIHHRSEWYVRLLGRKTAFGEVTTMRVYGHMRVEHGGLPKLELILRKECYELHVRLCDIVDSFSKRFAAQSCKCDRLSYVLANVVAARPTIPAYWSVCFSSGTKQELTGFW